MITPIFAFLSVDASTICGKELSLKMSTITVRRNIEIEARLFSANESDLFDQPYITCVDAEQEFVVLYNPRNEYFHLDGYSIADGKLHHTYRFPRRCKIPPRTEYCIYTCPGAANFDHGSLMEFHVLWTNHDGSLRKMEVLNNAYCDVKLIAPDGTVISHCEAHAANPQAAERLRYQAKQNSAAWRLGGAVQSCMIYARIVALFGMAASSALQRPVWYLVLYWVALVCDVFSRGKQERNPTLTTLSLLGDRLCSLVLTVSLLHLLVAQHAVSDTGGAVYSGTLGAVVWNRISLSGVKSWGSWFWSGIPGLSYHTLVVALALELLAVVLNMRHLLYPCPSSDILAVSGLNLPADVQLNPDNEEDSGENTQDEDSNMLGFIGNNSVADLYTVLKGVNASVLTVLCVGAEYYTVHCYTSFHYVYPATTSLTASWAERCWQLAVALGCLAFTLKMLNNATLVLTGLYKLHNK